MDGSVTRSRQIASIRGTRFLGLQTNYYGLAPVAFSSTALRFRAI